MFSRPKKFVFTHKHNEANGENRDGTQQSIYNESAVLALAVALLIGYGGATAFTPCYTLRCFPEGRRWNTAVAVINMVTVPAWQ